MDRDELHMVLALALEVLAAEAPGPDATREMRLAVGAIGRAAKVTPGFSGKTWAEAVAVKCRRDPVLAAGVLEILRGPKLSVAGRIVSRIEPDATAEL